MLVVYHQPIPTKCGTIPIQRTTITSLSNTAIIKVITIVTLWTYRYAIILYFQVCRCSFALRTAQVIGVYHIIAKVGFANY